LLALVPVALADVPGNHRAEYQLDRLRLTAEDAEGRAGVLGGIEIRRHVETLVEHLDLLDPLHGEGADLAVLVRPGV
jgi:hypothetical protein